MGPAPRTNELPRSKLEGIIKLKFSGRFADTQHGLSYISWILPGQTSEPGTLPEIPGGYPIPR